MFNWIKSLFGKGKIRVTLVTSDGMTGSAVVPYVGDIDTLDMVEFKDYVKREVLVEHGKIVTSMKIIGYTR